MNGFLSSSMGGWVHRAVLTLVLMVLFSLQPGLYSTTAAAAMKPVSAAATILTDHQRHGEMHVHSTADQTLQDHAQPHKHDGKSGDKRCEAHCATANALPVAYAALSTPDPGVHHNTEATLPADGLLFELNQPPRT